SWALLLMHPIICSLPGIFSTKISLCPLTDDRMLTCLPGQKVRRDMIFRRLSTHFIERRKDSTEVGDSHRKEPCDWNSKHFAEGIIRSRTIDSISPCLDGL